MTENEILEAAKEANLSIRGHYDETGSTPSELQRFAKIVEAKVLEKAALIAEDSDAETYQFGGVTYDDVPATLRFVAAEIRALKDES